MKKSLKVGSKVDNQEDVEEDDDGDEEDFEGRDRAVGTMRGHHVYTGESLLEVILADHSFQYNHDKKMLSGAHTRGEHKVFLPSIFSVISLQSTILSSRAEATVLHTAAQGEVLSLLLFSYRIKSCFSHSIFRITFSLILQNSFQNLNEILFCMSSWIYCDFLIFL